MNTSNPFSAVRPSFMGELFCSTPPFEADDGKRVSFILLICANPEVVQHLIDRIESQKRTGTAIVTEERSHLITNTSGILRAY